MMRVKVNWGQRGTAEFKCEGTSLHSSGRVLVLRDVLSQDPGSYRVLAKSKLIPLDSVLEVDESAW